MYTERILPIDGAQVVAFSYEAAEAATAALALLPDALSSQAAARAREAESVTQWWAGGFRQEYDAAQAALLGRFELVADGHRGLAVSIAGAVDRANEAQLAYNRQRHAELEAEAAAAAAAAVAAVNGG
ncbi:MAG: hypothetical protein ACRD0G_13645 [Acidimicrobiales bacterium]